MPNSKGAGIGFKVPTINLKGPISVCRKVHIREYHLFMNLISLSIKEFSVNDSKQGEFPGLVVF